MVFTRRERIVYEEPYHVEGTHAASRRTVIFEDDGDSAWLYLTGPNSYKPVATCWVYNRVEAPSVKEIAKYMDGPPPACKGYIANVKPPNIPEYPAVEFIWSDSGNSVAIVVYGVLKCYVSSEWRDGWSRDVVADGPFGKPWSHEAWTEVNDRRKLP